MTLTIGAQLDALSIDGYPQELLLAHDDLSWAIDVYGLSGVPGVNMGDIKSILLIGRDETVADQVWVSSVPMPLISTVFTLTYLAPNPEEHCVECGNSLPQYYPDSRCARCLSGH